MLWVFFLDYIAVEKLNKKIALDIIDGISKGCKDANCSILGGETAEMPGTYNKNKFDLAITIIKEKEKINLAKIALEARGEISVRGNIYQFGSLNHKIEPTVNYTKKPLKKVLQQGSIIYLVEPLPRRILRLLVLLRQRYLN